MAVNRRYFLKADWQPEWTEVTKEEYIRAERSAGFRSKFGPDDIATAGFTSSSGVSGRVEYDNI